MTLCRVNLPKMRLCRLYDFGRGFSRTECVDNDATNADQPPVFVLHSDHGSIRGNPISYESTTQAGISAARLAQSGFGCSACGALPVVRVRQVQVTGLRNLNSRENRSHQVRRTEPSGQVNLLKRRLTGGIGVQKR